MAPNVCSVNPYYVFDYWTASAPENESVELTIFMPNGIVLILKTNKTATLAEVKEVSRTTTDGCLIHVFCLIIFAGFSYSSYLMLACLVVPDSSRATQIVQGCAFRELVDPFPTEMLRRYRLGG